MCEKFGMEAVTKVIWYPHGETVEYEFIPPQGDLPWVRLTVYRNTTTGTGYLETSISVHNQLDADDEIGMYPDIFAEWLKGAAKIAAFTRGLYSVDLKPEVEAVIRDAA